MAANASDVVSENVRVPDLQTTRYRQVSNPRPPVAPRLGRRQEYRVVRLTRTALGLFLPKPVPPASPPPTVVGDIRSARQTARIRPSCWSAVTPSSSPISSAILPFSIRSTVVPANRIVRPLASGNAPTRKSLKAGPVCVPPPSQRPTTYSPSAMRSAAPQKLRFGNAARNPDMNALMSARPRRGACNEYCRSMLGAASSSTMPRLQVSPQNSVNQRPTMVLLSSSFDTVFSFAAVLRRTHARFAHARMNVTAVVLEP